jgi:hypothetical protein
LLEAHRDSAGVRTSISSGEPLCGGIWRNGALALRRSARTWQETAADYSIDEASR